jgi:formamidopyrimidine-DNA glycosylase
MPELPEVETVKRGLEPVLLGMVVKKLTLNRPNLRIPFPDDMALRIEDKKCINLRRRGKYIWMDMEGGDTLVIHLGMSGSFSINNTNDASPHNHVIFETERGDIITYNDPRRFGMMFFVKTGDEHAHKSFASMGVEPLGNDFHGGNLLSKIEFKKSPIKPALLDQSVVAGVGNIYACEALYRAGISPLKSCDKITVKQADLLVQYIRNVLNDAIESGGSSLRDHKQTDGTMGYFQHQFDVYGREGEKCRETGGVIKRITQSGRSTFYCPQKQR